MIGDGGINNPWQANITLNAEADAYYASHVIHLSETLFDIRPAVRKRANTKTLVISLSSTTLVDYLVRNGLVRGNKIVGNVQIPDWIMEKPVFKLACLRGLMDTDGCLFIHKHKVGKREYENIGLCFTNYAPNIINQAATIFEEFGIIPHVSNKGRRIYVYERDSVIRYMDRFGTSNPRIGTLYENWRRRIVV